MPDEHAAIRVPEWREVPEKTIISIPTILICPIRTPHPNTPYADRDTRCIRERCAWWCSYGEPSLDPHGRCAILEIAIATGQIS